MNRILFLLYFGATALAELPAGAANAPTPAADILDIRGPVHIPPPFPWLTCSIGAAVVITVALLVWKLARRSRRLLPYEVALQRLEAARPLMQPDNAEAFCVSVSETVRGFIEQSFPVSAPRQTTAEFLQDAVRLTNGPLGAQREALALFLHHCDLAKFARWNLSLAQMGELLGAAREFVLAVGQPGKGSAGSASAAGETASPQLAHS
jgi:hypothetical protein